MASFDLTKRERDQLEQTFRSSRDPRLRDRTQAVLMASRGRLHADIALDLSTSVRSVRRWLALWRERGLEGLEIEWAPGASPLIDVTLAPEVLRWVTEGPASCGLNRANWTAAELARHLERTHGVKIAERTMRSFLDRHDVHPYRPTYRFLRADEAKQAKAREDLAELKKKPKPARSSS
jgi:transposase